MNKNSKYDNLDNILWNLFKATGDPVYYGGIKGVQFLKEEENKKDDSEIQRQ